MSKFIRENLVGCLILLGAIGAIAFYSRQPDVPSHDVATLQGPTSTTATGDWFSDDHLYQPGPKVDTKSGPKVTVQAQPTGISRPPVKLDLEVALKRKLVEIAARGSGLDSVKVEISSLSASDLLRVRIPAGTFFMAGVESTQNMVVRKEQIVELEPDSQTTVKLDAACANMRRGVPKGSDGFDLGPPASGDLRRLLMSRSFEEATFRVQQFSIWTITDNPKRDDYVGIASGFGLGFAPDAGEMAEVRRLFAAARIDSAKYPALKESDNPAVRARKGREAESERASKALEAAAAAETKRREDAEQERRRVEVISTTKQGARSVIKVQLLSEQAAILSVAELSEIAATIAKDPANAVWFYLPGMKATGGAWAVASWRNNQFESRIFPDRATASDR